MYSAGFQCEASTPFESLPDIKPDLAHLRQFGCKHFANIPRQVMKGQFSSQARLGAMVGYEIGVSYKMFITELSRIIVTMDVRIIEKSSNRFRSKGPYIYEESI